MYIPCPILDYIIFIIIKFCILDRLFDMWMSILCVKYFSVRKWGKKGEERREWERAGEREREREKERKREREYMCNIILLECRKHLAKYPVCKSAQSNEAPKEVIW